MENSVKKWISLGIRNSRSGGKLATNTSMVLLERILLAGWRRTNKPQVFILGLPRSGTTLVYQYLVHRLEVAYFTNGVGRFPGAPCATTLIQRILHRPSPSDFESRYGRVSGALGPREAGAFWARFFGLDGYIGPDDVRPEDALALRRTIGCLQRIYGDAVFVNKNVKHQLRIRALQEIFPDARFLMVERDLGDVALSVLRGRYQNLDDPTSWWSVKPPDYEKMRGLPITEQVARQVLSLNRRISEDLEAVSPQRVLRVAYSDFCEDPETLARRLMKLTVPIPDRHAAIESFPVSRNHPRNDEEVELLDRLEQLGHGDRSE